MCEIAYNLFFYTKLHLIVIVGELFLLLLLCLRRYRQREGAETPLILHLAGKFRNTTEEITKRIGNLA